MRFSVLFVQCTLVSTFACVEHAQPAPLSPETVEGEGPARPEAVFAVDTRRAHVMRVDAAREEEEKGNIRVSSTLAGVFVRIDGAERLPLPAELELEVGSHVVTAICPDGREETSRAVVLPGETVELRVCSPPD